tara:strand:+ start:1114 stop:1341 length:228 start_codon:yes stop_codon:yes gene_type:complete
MKHIAIDSMESIGNYALRIVFSDGHDTGIYSWDYLADLSQHQEEYWQKYLGELQSANASRLPTIPVGHWKPEVDA